MSQGRWLRLLASVCFVGFVGLAYGQANPEDEYRKLIHVNEDIQPLGEHPFGENISLFDGGLSFDQTDISLQGNGPILQLTRHFEVYGDLPINGNAEPVFADWELDVPRLETLTAGADTPMWDYSASGQLQAINGWQTDNTTVASGQPVPNVNARCSNFTPPPSVVFHMGDPALQFWDPADWWKGYHLLMPGQGGQNMLFNADASTQGTYPAVTKDHWRFSCLASTANGQPGEGFLGHAPDGTTYWFDYLVYRDAEGMSRQLDSSDASLLPKESLQRLVNQSIENLISLLSGSSVAHAAPITDGISRRLGVLLVTRVQDRFGNYLTYKYDANGYLTGIVASDGRALSVTYVSGTTLVHSVTLQPASGAPRTWVYSYSADNLHLVDVQLPDGSHWQYNMAALQNRNLRGGTGLSSCETLRVPAYLSPVSATITHPSGLVGQFTVQGIKHGRSFVPEACRDMYAGNPDSQGSYASFPKAWYSYTTTQITLSGAGMPTRTWSYHYSPSNDSWSTCTGSCPTTVWTDVVAPDGSTERSTFSNRFDVTEGQLLRTDDYSGAPGSSTLLRSQLNGYAPPTTAPLPAVAGHVGMLNVNRAQYELYSPLNRRAISQDGDSYTWQAETFNSFVQVTKAKRYSSIAGQGAVEEQTDYLNDTTHWVLGLPTQVTNLSNAVTPEVVDKNVYDTTDDTLAERWHFGQKLMSYSFNAQGQLASFTDGNGHATTLSNYKRGIPQAIGYPDGTAQSLVVDDFGQIQSITDQAGATTSYDYDAVGRLTRIDYPTGDEQAWYPKTLSYAFVTSAERGVEANHWRRTIAKGNQRQVTYFNAELQPVLTDTSIYGDATSDVSQRNNFNFRGLTTFASYPAAGSPNLTDITAGTASQYDALGRLIQTQQTATGGLLTTSIAYLSGTRKQVTDPKNFVTTTTYQVFDEPSYETALKVEAPTGLTQTIARDEYGNPLWINQAGPDGTGTVSLTKTLTYDGYHRLCRTTEPESGSEVMAYDGANNLAWSAAGLSLTGTDCGQDQVADAGKTVRSYDAMNRLLTLTPPAGTQSTAYGYDALGNLKSAISGISTWSATRNKLGQLTGETLQLTGQGGWHVGYAHDAYGSVRTLTYPDGAAVAYTPDALGRATQVGSYATGIRYFPNGEVQSFAFGNGALYSAEQNVRQVLTNFTYGHGSTLDISEDLAYDPDSNITNVTDLVDGRRTKAFGYDALNRLTSATASNLWGTETYTYDPLNNIKTRVGNGATFTYNYDASNRLASISGAGSTNFGYDSRGNVTGKNGTTLQFDQKNQLTQIDGLASYSYDAAGRRVAKTPNGGNPTYYFYTQAGQLLFQYEPDGGSLAKLTDYLYLGRKLIARNEQTVVAAPPAAVASVSATANGSVVAVTWANSSYTDSYQLEQSLNGVWTNLYTGAGLSYTVSETAAGSYVFRVTPCNTAGCGIPTSSAAVTVTPPATPTVAAPATNSTGSYTVSWNATAGASSYTLQEQVNGGSWATVQTSGVTSLAISGKGNGTYGYRVEACNSAGCSAWSATYATVVTHPPGAPTLSAPTSNNTGSYTVSWAAVSTASSYTLQEQVNGGAWTTVYTGAGTSKAISGKHDATYGYHAQACNAGGCSGWSALHNVAVALPPLPPPNVQLIDTTAGRTESYAVKWGAVANATRYEVSRNGSVFYSGTATTIGLESGYIGYEPKNVYQLRACNAVGCSAWERVL